MDIDAMERFHQAGLDGVRVVRGLQAMTDKMQRHNAEQQAQIEANDARLRDQDRQIRANDGRLAEQGRDIRVNDETLAAQEGRRGETARELKKLEDALAEVRARVGV